MECPKCLNKEIYATLFEGEDIFICAKCGERWDEDGEPQGKLGKKILNLLGEVMEDYKMIDDMEVIIVSSVKTVDCVFCGGTAVKDDDDYVCNKCGQGWSVV